MNIESRKIKKTFAFVSIGCISAAAIIGLLFLFKVFKDSPESVIKTIGYIALTILVIFCASLFILNAVDALEQRKVLGIVTLSLIGFSSLLFFILIWFQNVIELGFFQYLIVIISMVSILLDLFVGNYIRLGKRLFILQIIFIVFFIYFEVALSMAILGNSVLIKEGLLTYFIADILVFITIEIILLILGKKEFKKVKNNLALETDKLKERIKYLEGLLDENNISYEK